MTSSARAKGYRSQSKCIKFLEGKGYEVSIVERSSKFSKQKDAFGLFDLSAMNDKHTLWIQVTTNRPHTHKNFIEFSRVHPLSDSSFEQWVWIDRKGWKVFKYKKGKKFVEDTDSEWWSVKNEHS